MSRPARMRVRVRTSRSTVRVLAHGYRPVLTYPAQVRGEEV